MQAACNSGQSRDAQASCEGFLSCFLNAADYDECDSGEDDCAPGSSCRNSLGSFTCSCEGGTPDLPVEYSGRPCEGNSLRIPCPEYAQIACSLKDIHPQSAYFLNEIGMFLCLGQVSVCVHTCKHAYVHMCMCVHMCAVCTMHCVHTCKMHIAHVHVCTHVQCTCAQCMCVHMCVPCMCVHMCAPRVFVCVCAHACAAPSFHIPPAFWAVPHLRVLLLMPLMRKYTHQLRCVLSDAKR